MTANEVTRYIRPAKNRYVLIKSNYRTDDIIQAVLDADKSGVCADVAEVAKHIKYNGLDDLSRQLFDLLKNNIQYREDPLGMQGVRTPAALWATRTGDCKSYSLFVGSILKCLGIPYIYRFAAYNDRKTIQHVYPVAVGKNKNYIIDAVYGHYNLEKPYTLIKDFEMNGLYRIEGVGASEPITRMQKPVDEMTEADMDLFILQQRLETERDIVAGQGAIGAVKAAEYDATLSGLSRFIAAANVGDVAGMDAVIGAVKTVKAKNTLKAVKAKVVAPKPALKTTTNLAKKAPITIKANTAMPTPVVLKSQAAKVTPATSFAASKPSSAPAKPAAKKKGGLLKTVTKVVKKTVIAPTKAVTKVVTAPARLVVKGVIEATLPKAAPAFLYLFVNDKALIEKLPAKVRAKRKKQEKFADFVVNAIGMKRNHFMGILRNGIMKEYKMSPEKKIEQMMKKQGVSGIGIAPAIIAAIPALINAIAKIFGKKPSESFGQGDCPSDDDFVTATGQPVLPAAQQTQLANEIRSQADSTEPGESLTTEAVPESGGRKLFGIC